MEPARMRHARPASLDTIETDVLAAVRRHPALRERSRGVFHHRSRAFLHFHEDGTDVYADVRLADGWRRLRVRTKADRARLVATVARALAPSRR